MSLKNPLARTCMSDILVMVRTPVSVRVPESLPYTTCSVTLIEYVPMNLSASFPVEPVSSFEQDKRVKEPMAIATALFNSLLNVTIVLWYYQGCILFVEVVF